MFSLRMTQLRLAILPLIAVGVLAALGAADPAGAKSKHRDEKKDPYAMTTRTPGNPVLALVSLKDQRVTIYDADGPILRAPVSSGQTGLETPVGIYAVLQKEAEHYSNVYDDAAMPNMERITWSGVALHGGPLPGYPASHGCVRMPYKFAERLFGLTKVGMRVIISRNDVSPVPISHPLLFKRTPYHDSAGLVTKAAALVGNMIGESKPGDEPADVTERKAALQEIVATKTAEADAIDKKAEPARALAKQRTPDMKRAKKALRAAEKSVERATGRVVYADKILDRAKSEKSKKRAEARKAKAEADLVKAQGAFDAVQAKAQPKIDAYQEAADALKALEDERDAARTEASEAERKLSPVSVFISLKTQKLYVRQGFQPVFESPVTIRDPFTPIGTHTYTAVDYAKDGRQMRWTVVSIAGRQPGDYADYDSSYDDYNDYDDWGRPRRRRHRARATSSKPTPTDVAAARAALDRITIPEDVVARISKLVLPGTSLIVSDEEASKETGKQTDFVVLISGEPQGGIRKRPRQMNPYYDDFYGYRGNDYYDRRSRRRQGGPFFRWW